MSHPFDPPPLTDSTRLLVDRALADGSDRELAIDALERHLSNGGTREPQILLALATLTYEDAATLVLHRLAQASKTALALVDEAMAQQDQPTAELDSLRTTFAASLERERARERRLRSVLHDPAGATPAERMMLAHQILMSGEDDQLAAELMAIADAPSAN